MTCDTDVIGGSNRRGGRLWLECAPFLLSLISFISMQFSSKLLPNNGFLGLDPPRQGNPGSTSGHNSAFSEPVFPL